MEYLIDGEIRIWNGEMNPVNSPIFYQKEGEFCPYSLLLSSLNEVSFRIKEILILVPRFGALST